MRHLSNASLVARIFEAVAYPTFLVDAGVHVLHANGAAERLLGHTAGQTGQVPRRIGDLLACEKARGDPAGCRASPRCDDCVIAGSVRRALEGEPVRRILAFVDRREHGQVREVCLQVSAAAIEHERRKLAVVTLDDVTDVYHLRSLVPLCGTCDRFPRP